jgi:hypothetical protein
MEWNGMEGITHHASRITHHASRITHPRITHPASRIPHASRITHPASRITHHRIPSRIITHPVSLYSGPIELK